MGATRTPLHWMVWIMCLMVLGVQGWGSGEGFRHRSRPGNTQKVLSSDYLENDLVAVCPPGDSSPRLCVVRPDGTVSPLCLHEDDVETDLFVDPRSTLAFWKELLNDDVAGTYSEGWYGQRPVPSLGGGPGYGAEADEIWSVSEEVLEQLMSEGVKVPVLDVGIAHGEKARGGAF